MRNAVAAVVALLLGGTAWAQQAQSPAPAPHGGHGGAPGAQQRPMSDQDLIASAMSAAPKSVAEGATIIVMDASNTDPYATGPSPGGAWVDTGPHVMIVGPAAARMAGYPRGVQPDTTQPYVMWAGTSYEHLMIPTR